MIRDLAGAQVVDQLRVFDAVLSSATANDAITYSGRETVSGCAS
jgi:hypothetical protein